MRFDLDLFERLNEEYRATPIHAASSLAQRRRMLTPTTEDRAAIPRDERVRYAHDFQLKPILKDVDVANRTVLDVGCGYGYLSAALVECAGAARAIGVDVEPAPNWDEHRNPDIDLIHGDMSAAPLVAPESVDVVVSQVVFEHVTRPVQLLAAVYAAMKPGATAWLRLNIFAARNASHLYNEVFFPWPHLLFEDRVVAEFYRRHHALHQPRFPWINRMTVAHYLHVCRTLGFDLLEVRRKISPIDVPFYLRFEDTLGRYQALDLESDFLILVLGKGMDAARRTEAAVAGVNYLARQRELDGRIAQHQASTAENAAGERR
jgi:SAM-dependent methyltransferase